jgi:hypothetical protein
MFLKIPYKAYIFSFLATFLSLVTFIYSSFFGQINQVFSLNLPLGISLSSILELVKESFSAMGFFAAVLLILWILALFIFYTTFFGLIIVKRKYQPADLKIKKGKHTLVGGLSFFLSWISFGCIACGQALLTSIVALFVTQVSVGLLHNVVNFVLLISIIILLNLSYRNYKLLSNPKICPI